MHEIENNLLPQGNNEKETPYNLRDRMLYYSTPGVSIAIIKNFKIDWVGHFGVRNAKSRKPVTDDTLFLVGSLSKAITAAIILYLIDHGKFNLDDNVNDYLRSWKIPENEFTKAAPVTVRRLLNHTSGLMNSPPNIFAPVKMPTLIQYLNGVSSLRIPPTTIDYVPGTAYKYSNAGYSILQILVEDVTGLSYPEFAKNVLFNPIKMKHSFFEQPISLERGFYASKGHKSDGTEIEFKRFGYPSLAAGGLWSTAEDYARFITEIQRTIKGHLKRLMSQNLAQQMIPSHEAKEYGLGVSLSCKNGDTFFDHIGDLCGFVAGFSAHSTNGYGAVVMTNNDNSYGIVEEIISGIAWIYNWKNYLLKSYL